AEAGEETIPYLVDRLKDGSISFAAEDPDTPENFPRIWSIWRANTLGSSAKGDQDFFPHLPGVASAAPGAATPPQVRPPDLTCRGREVAGSGSARAGRSRPHPRFPHDQPHPALRRGAAGVDLVREA